MFTTRGPDIQSRKRKARWTRAGVNGNEDASFRRRAPQRRAASISTVGAVTSTIVSSPIYSVNRAHRIRDWTPIARMHWGSRQSPFL